MADSSRVVPRSFFDRSVLDVAPGLLGKLLVVNLGGSTVTGRIVETEAYGADDDPASHAYQRRTHRNAVMFGPPGHLYMYFIYGMHWCANVVTGAEGDASAVLIRALEPVAGVPEMQARRTGRRDRDLTNGPGKLSAALGLTGAQNFSDLTGHPSVVQIRDDGTPPPDAPGVSSRVGISVAQDYLWRFYIAGNPWVSRARPSGGTDV